jgi:hypothetical protein
MDFVYIGKSKSDNQALVFNEKETDGIRWFKREEVLADNFETSLDVKTMCKSISEMIWGK